MTLKKKKASFTSDGGGEKRARADDEDVAADRRGRRRCPAVASRAGGCKEHFATRAPAMLGVAFGRGSPVRFAHAATTLTHGPAVAPRVGRCKEHVVAQVSALLGTARGEGGGRRFRLRMAMILRVGGSGGGLVSDKVDRVGCSGASDGEEGCSAAGAAGFGEDEPALAACSSPASRWIKGGARRARGAADQAELRETHRAQRSVRGAAAVPR